MSLLRREFLAGSAGVFIASRPVFALSTAFATAPPPRSVRVVRSRRQPLPAFEQGARSALLAAGHASRAVLQLPAKLELSQWQRLLAEARGSVLVGLVCDTEFALVNELVREASGRVLAEGAHRVSEDLHSRHVFTTTAASVGVGSAFAGQLRATSLHALVTEVALIESPARARPVDDRALRHDHWAGSLGRIMGTVAAGTWIGRTIEPPSRVGSKSVRGVAHTRHDTSHTSLSSPCRNKPPRRDMNIPWSQHSEGRHQRRLRRARGRVQDAARRAERTSRFSNDSWPYHTDDAGGGLTRAPTVWGAARRERRTRAGRPRDL